MARDAFWPIGEVESLLPNFHESEGLRRLINLNAVGNLHKHQHRLGLVGERVRYKEWQKQ
jgi:hypothetical protein